VPLSAWLSVVLIAIDNTPGRDHADAQSY